MLAGRVEGTCAWRAFFSASTIGRGAARCTCGSASTSARSAKTWRASPSSASTSCASSSSGRPFSPNAADMDRHDALRRFERVMGRIADCRSARDADAVLRTHERRELAAGLDARSAMPQRPLSHDQPAAAIVDRTASATSTPIRELLRAQVYFARASASACATIPRSLPGISATSSPICASRRRRRDARGVERAPERNAARSVAVPA